jgi:hypothetical protein
MITQMAEFVDVSGETAVEQPGDVHHAIPDLQPSFGQPARQTLAGRNADISTDFNDEDRRS